MPPLKQHPHLVRLTAAALIATVLQACTSWHVRSLEPAQFSPSVHPGSARLTLADGSRFTVRSPVIRGDSLFGSRVPSQTPVALALTSVRGVEVAQTDRTKTALLLGGLSVIGLTLLIVTSSDELEFFF